MESVVKACNDGLELGLAGCGNPHGVRYGRRYRPQWLRVRCAERFLPGYQFYRGRLDPSEKHQTEVYKYTHEFHERFTKLSALPAAER